MSNLYKRIVVKVGTNLLTSGSDRLDPAVLSSLVSQVAELHAAGVQTVIVSSGAIAAGQEALGAATGRKDIPYKQVLAAVGQSRLMHRYQELFQERGIQVAQALITKGDLDNREGYLNVRNTLEGLLDLGVVPIINENDVVDVREIAEIVFGDNDSLSAAVANLVDADLLALLTDIDGLYSSDPRRNLHAEFIHRVERIDKRIETLAGGAGSRRGRGGMMTKIEAAKVATAAGVTVVIASGHVPSVLLRLANGEAIGTLFAPTGDRIASRRRWLLSGLGSKGRIIVDDGAARALCQDNRSLLPAGISGVSGGFTRGDVVDICDSDGVRLASGLTQYTAADVSKIKGNRTGNIVKKLGYKYGDEVVHRNDMALVTPPNGSGSGGQDTKEMDQ